MRLWVYFSELRTIHILNPLKYFVCSRFLLSPAGVCFSLSVAVFFFPIFTRFAACQHSTAKAADTDKGRETETDGDRRRRAETYTQQQENAADRGKHIRQKETDIAKQVGTEGEK